MVDEKYTELLVTLLERTKAGQVNWHSTSYTAEFIVYFDDFSFAILQYYDDSPAYTLTPYPNFPRHSLLRFDKI